MTNPENNKTPITLLRVEGVNLGHSIGDTEQLSTRRGGGLLLLQAIGDVKNRCSRLKPISTGASIGLFSIESSPDAKTVAQCMANSPMTCSATSCSDAKSVAQCAREFLATHHLYKHATFMVVTVEENSKLSVKERFQTAQEQTLAKIRWEQMQSLSFSAQGLDPAGKDYTVCTFDEVRPAHDIVHVRRDESDTVQRKVSDSVKARHDYGRIKKQAWVNRGYFPEDAGYRDTKGFYEEGLEGKFLAPWDGMSTELKSLCGNTPVSEFLIPSEVLKLIYTQHFEDLSRKRPDKGEAAVLEGKMAVFYADGNKFARIAWSCENSTDLTKWDDYIKDQRKKLLAGIVTRANEYEHWKTPPIGNGPNAGKRKIRLEILLWGGDELIFVVPGWCGIEFAQLFFEATKHMKYPRSEDGKSAAAEADDLTHACGMVFCHHQAPISGISKLAKKLADAVKKSSDQKQENLLNWMVLESFDHAQADLDDLKKARYPYHTPTWDAIALKPEAVDALHYNLPGLKDDLPRSVIVRIVRMMACGAAFTQPKKSKDTATTSDKTPAPAKPEDEAAIPDKLLCSSYRSLDETISKMADGGKRFKALWHALQLKPITEKLDSLRPEELAEAKRKAESEAQWNPNLPKPEDMAVWVKLLELWDYCPGLYPPAEPENSSSSAAASDASGGATASPQEKAK